MINWIYMDFGTAENPICGICGSMNNDGGMWDEDGEICEDVICDECNKIWIYDNDTDAYIHKV